MALGFWRRNQAAAPKAEGEPVVAENQQGTPVYALAQTPQRDTSGLGLEAAELRGTLEDSSAMAQRQADAFTHLAEQLHKIGQAQQQIQAVTNQSLASVAEARGSVAHVGNEVSGVVETLKQVADAAKEITQVAFNASVEAKRAGEAGRGFSVVADAVKDLATQVESSSKLIMSTVSRLDDRIQSLSRDLLSTEESIAAAQGKGQRASPFTMP
jgi:methyl-accepting chemotaxis protein